MYFVMMVGFEPTIFGLQGRRSLQTDPHPDKIHIVFHILAIHATRFEPPLHKTSITTLHSGYF